MKWTGKKHYCSILGAIRERVFESGGVQESARSVHPSVRLVAYVASPSFEAVRRWPSKPDSQCRSSLTGEPHGRASIRACRLLQILRYSMMVC